MYYIYPYYVSKYLKQGGKLLVNNAVNSNKQYVLASYQTLNNIPDLIKAYNYSYAISFWFFVNSINSSGKPYDKYCSILNYGGKPNILYNPNSNTLIITMVKTDMKQVDVDNSSKKTYTKLDDSGNKILYTNKNLLLQKWNNVVINYNGGTLDIFYNGKLVRSYVEIVPYMNYDTLSIGEDNGVNGGICNVNYFDKSLNVTQIYHLYN